MVIDTCLATHVKYSLPEAMGTADGQSADGSGRLQLVRRFLEAGLRTPPSAVETTSSCGGDG
jgi:hypothetical protein